jgi:RNA polymerase sigma factor (sigma-70 family)
LTGTAAEALRRAVEGDRGRILAALIARLGRFDLAEEAFQDAAASALTHWERSGVPLRPDAWLIRVAFRKAIDRLRRAERDEAGAEALARLAREEAEDPDMIADERLRLIFTCCHPALDEKSRVALTLRTVCGLSTRAIAAAFLDSESTMGQRLSRAKAKIAGAGIPFRVPEPDDWPGRLGSVLNVIYLIYTAGYDSPAAADCDLCAEALFLARLLVALRPEEAEVEGALALLLLTEARRHARTDDAGMSLPLDRQDAGRWDWAMIGEGLGILTAAMARPGDGPYRIKAALAALRLRPFGPDWQAILALYDRLLVFEPTPVVRLNRAVVLAETGALASALLDLANLETQLADYQPFHAAQADLLRRANHKREARGAYARAIALCTRPQDAAFLARRLSELGPVDT